MDKLFSKPILDSSDIFEEDELETEDLDLSIKKIDDNFKETKPIETLSFEEEVKTKPLDETKPIDTDSIFSKEVVISTDDYKVKEEEIAEGPLDSNEMADFFATEPIVTEAPLKKYQEPKTKEKTQTKNKTSRYVIIGLICLVVILCVAWFVLAMNSKPANETTTQTKTKTEQTTPTTPTRPTNPSTQPEDNTDNDSYDSDHYYSDDGYSDSYNQSNSRPQQSTDSDIDTPPSEPSQPSTPETPETTPQEPSTEQTPQEPADDSATNDGDQIIEEELTTDQTDGMTDDVI